jgi:nicotinate phosphoribosyltransferase
VSESVEKITNPGLKEVWRVYDEDGHAVADLIALPGELDEMTGDYDGAYVDPEHPWRRRKFPLGVRYEPLRKLVMEGGRRTGEPVETKEIAAYVRRQLSERIWQEEQRFENPHRHFLDMTPAYYEMKMELLDKSQNPE